MVGPMSTSSFIKPRTFPVPADEPERLKALAGYGIVAIDETPGGGTTMRITLPKPTAQVDLALVS